MLNTVVAGGSQQALKAAQKQEAHRHYAAVPERNWASGTPVVIEREPVVKWENISPDQLSVDDVLDDINDDKKEKIEEARAALEDDRGRPAPVAAKSKADDSPLD